MSLVVGSYRRFGTACLSYLQEYISKGEVFLSCLGKVTHDHVYSINKVVSIL